MIDTRYTKKKAFKEGEEFAANSSSSEDIQKECDRRTHTLINEIKPEITELNLKGSLLVNDEKNSADVLSNSSTPTACSLGFFQGVMWLMLSAVFIAGTWASIRWTFAPFGFNNVLFVSLTALGFGSGHYLMKKLANLFPDKDVKKASAFIIMTAFIMFLVAEVNSGIVRNSRMIFNMDYQNSRYVEDIDTVAESNVVAQAHDFYDTSSGILKIIMPLLAISLSLSSAVIFHEGFERVTVDGSTLYNYGRLRQIRRLIISTSKRIKELEVLPEIYASEFMRGAERIYNRNNSENTDVDDNRTLWRVMLIYAFSLITVLMLVSIAFSADSVITLVDLSTSSGLTDYKKDEEFQKNLKAIEGIIMHLREGTTFTVIGITESSFGRPYLIMGKRLGKDPGYFGEKLQAGREMLIKEWRKVSKDLRPDARGSDIFGAVALAAFTLKRESSGKKSLIILSDMRQCCNKYNFEKMPIISIDLIERIETEVIIPELKGVDVYVLGAHTINIDHRYWESLEKFWKMFFKKSGTDLKIFTYERRLKYE